MDSVGVHSLGSAAAQGGQDTSTEHANGSHFTGWDMGVQASQDAAHHVKSGLRCSVCRVKNCETGLLSPTERAQQ